MPSKVEILRCVDVVKVYGTRGSITQALNHVNLSIYQGDFVAIMGPSGCGKSTLLNCISTIDKITDGQVLLDGEDLTKLSSAAKSKFRRERLGFVFQDSNLLDTLTARENIKLALSINHIAPAEMNSRIEEVSRRLGITDVLDKYPSEMSGGQQQRVACARAMVTKPALILADEPTGALDSKNSRILLESFTQMHNAGATIVMVTHDATAASFAQHVLFMRDGQLYTELYAYGKDRSTYFNEILNVVAQLGGDTRAHA